MFSTNARSRNASDVDGVLGPLHLTAYLFLCSSGSKTQGEGPWRVPCQLKKPLRVWDEDKGVTLGGTAEEKSISPMTEHWFFIKRKHKKSLRMYHVFSIMDHCKNTILCKHKQVLVSCVLGTKSSTTAAHLTVEGLWKAPCQPWKPFEGSRLNWLSYLGYVSMIFFYKKCWQKKNWVRGQTCGGEVGEIAGMIPLLVHLMALWNRNVAFFVSGGKVQNSINFSHSSSRKLPLLLCT